ncbi:MAG: hypothetical protein FWD93_04805 [Coriobacteriia bacterium]|nr:hypothetical protein [Coriobacteriia bacterium]
MSDDFYISDELAKERAAQRAAELAHLSEHTDVTEEDTTLLHEQQQTPYHQSVDFQGKGAYSDQGYHPTSTELESKISWGLLIGCTVLFLLCTLISGGVVSLAILY